MYPKSFFENFWATEQKNELFVCMPFHESFESKFKVIQKVAKALGFKDAIRTKEGTITNDLVQEILDGIGNSKTLLVDLSHDLSEKGINRNVIYEFGVANTIREPEDILVIKQKFPTPEGEEPPKEVFDIGHLRYNKHEGELTEEWLEPLLKKTVESQQWYKSKRVEAAAKSINMDGLIILNQIYTRNISHFHDANYPINSKVAILSLLELGIIFLNTACNGTEAAYYLTPFGNAVANHLGIQNFQ